MKRTLSYLLMSLAAAGTFTLTAAAQTSTEKSDEYVFTTVKACEITPVQDQASTGTCWSFSTHSFLEAESIRQGGPKLVTAPMYTAAMSYKDKARDYVRYHGNQNFAEGGSFYDVIYAVQHYGIVPMSEMQGLNYGTKRHNHQELYAITKGFLDGLLKNMDRRGTLSPVWTKAYDGIIDTYLGEAPKTFTVDGKTYTPESLRKAMKIDANNYVSLTSYMSQPLYEPYIIPIPDNWRHSASYNVTLDELMETIDNAINNGFTIAWGTDVSEPGFTRDGLGILADLDLPENAGSDQERWVGASDNQRHRMVMERISKPGIKEIDVTPEYRQQGFDTLELTDDHGMLIYGIAKDQNGKKFYMVKNSWGESGKYKGIWYVTPAFVAGKTMNIAIHKDALPKALRAKLGL